MATNNNLKDAVSDVLSIRLDRIVKGLALDIAILPLLRIPYLVQGVPLGESIINVLTIIICLLAVMSLLQRALAGARMSPWFCWLFAFLLSVYPYANGASPSSSLLVKRAATILYQFSICWMLYKEIKSGDSLWISSLSKLMYLLVIINLYTIIEYPGGLYHVGDSQFDSSYRNWLFGYDNRHIEFFLFALLLNMLNCINKHGKVFCVSTVILYLICLYSAITLMTATSIIALITFGALLMLISITGLTDIFNIYSYTIIYIIILFAIVEIATGSVNMPDGLFKLITNTLGKSVTFSERSQLWSNTIHWISRFPVFGNGIEDASVLLLKIGHASGPHNEFLNIIYEGGLIHFVCYVGLYCTSVRPLYSFRETLASKSITIAIISMFVAQTMRGCSPSIWLPFYLFATNCGMISSESKQSNPSL